MRKLVLIFCLAFVTVTASAQQIKQYVLDNTRAIRSNDIADADFDDLNEIGNAIGDASVVLLGEQDHGDAPAFKAKARLVKYLHEQKGFNVLAFESDFYGLQRGMETMELRAGSTAKLMKENIFTVWTKCIECEDVFRYMDTAAMAVAPIQITGFDSQLHGRYRTVNYESEVSAMLRSVQSKWVDSLTDILDNVQRYYPLHTVKHITLDTLGRYTRLLDSVNLDLQLVADSSFIKALMKSLSAYIYQQLYFRQNNGAYMTVRDKQMARNFLWLMRYRFPGQKIIIWAHNYHIAKNTIDAFPAKSGRHYSMGSELAQVLKDSMYVLGFTSYRGKAGRVGNPAYKVEKPKKESIEEWISTKGNAFSFVDLKEFREQNPSVKESFAMKGKLHENAEANWTDVFDGVFYIRDMYPCSAP